MRAVREFRRAPWRIVASVFALSLALGAIGVMGVPEVASSSLRDEATADAIANVAIESGQRVTMFLVSAGVDAVRRGAADRMQLNPSDPPLRDLVAGFVAQQGEIWVCPPCAEYRGYEEGCFIDGVEVKGSGPMHEKLRAGAASLCF